MSARRFVLIANPHAGGGRGERALEAVELALLDAGAEFHSVRTRDLEHGRAAAEEAVAAGAVAVAIGGDGLVGALAGAVAAAGGTLGIAPGGRGNDFARALGIPLDARQSAAVLLSGREREVDIGDCDGRPFVGIVSAGIDAEANRIGNDTRVLRGESVYLLAGLRALAAWHHASFSLRIDDEPVELHGFAVGVANSPFYGGGMKVVPQAEVGDGVLDVALFAEDSKWRFLRDLPRRASGAHVDNPAVSFRTGHVVTLDADRPLPVFADGEPIGTLPVTVRLRAGGLRVLAP